MVAADTSVLLRVVTGDDAEQLTTAEAFVRQGAWISHVVLVETVWALRYTYRLDHERIMNILDMLIEHKQLEIQAPDVVVAALDLYRRQPALGFSDCMILETARHAGHVPLGTFDRALARVAGATAL